MASPLQTFVSDLTTCGLMSAEELQVFLGAGSEGQSFEDAQTLALELVRHNKLTEYQAKALVKGEPKTLQIENYIVQEQLGSGGMGTVYKAEHRRLKRVVALKVLDRSALLTPRDVQRFHREVEAVAKLSHPNIVAALDAGEDDGTHFLVMEYVAGRDLSQTVKSDGPLPLSLALNYIIQAARGLQEAHASGIIHRDIKPANLLLDEAGTVKLLDLGLARFDEGRDEEEGEANTGLTQTGMIMGTADYMSPEQALDTHRADLRADIYSLGCTLHYLLLGRVVYSGNTVMKKLLAHREQPIPSLKAVRPDVPTAVDAAFAKMVAKTPELRFQSMSEVIRALEGCLQKLPASANRSPGMTAGADDLVSVNLDPVDTINVQEEPRSSTITSASQILGRGRKQKQTMLPLVIGVVAVLLVVIGMAFSLRSRKPKVKDEDSPSSSTSVAKTGNSKAKATKQTGPVAKLPPLGWGTPAETLPGLALSPPVLPGLGRWQVVSAAPQRYTYCIDWSPDGTRVVVGGSDGELRIYRVADWRLLAVLAGLTQNYYTVAWSPDGSRIATVGNQGIVKLWHKDGTPGPVLEGVHANTGLEWSPNGEWLALHSESYLGLWSPNGKRVKVFPFDETPPTDVAWNPDGTQLVSIRGRELRILNLDGSPVRNPIQFVHPENLQWVTWGSQGQIAALDFKGTAYVHPVHRADPQVVELPATALEFSPDGTQLAFTSNFGVEIHTADGKPTETRHPAFGAFGVAWSNDGKRVAWAGASIGVWEPWGTATQIPCGSNIAVFDLQAAGQSVTLHPNEGLRWWSSTGAARRFEPLSDGLHDAKWSPDSKTLAVGYFGGLAFSVDDGPLQVQFDQPGIQGMVWKPDGQKIAVPYERGARILDLQGNVLQEFSGHAQMVQLLDWSRSGLLATTDFFDVRLWNADGTPGPVLDIQDPLPKEDTNRRMQCLKWSPDGQFLAVGLNIGNNLRVFRTDGTSVASFSEPDAPHFLAWSPDGQQIAVAMTNGIRLWSTDGTPGKFLDGNLPLAHAIGWSRDNRIVARDGDGQLRCWDGATRQLLWVAVAVPRGGTATIDALGNITDSSRESVDQVLSYLVEREHGRLEALTPSEFQKLTRR